MADGSAGSPPPGSQGTRDGVLLYYVYVPLVGRDQLSVADWMQSMNEQLNLKGRIRVAEDGLNVTLGGRLADLENHIAQVRAHPLFTQQDIDFKLAASSGAINAQTSEETGFTQLHVRLCKELVTLGPLAAGRANPHTNAAPHLTPQQFHDMLLHSVPATTDTQTGPDTEGAPTQSRTGAEKETVLLDARNVYETRVGHFAKAGVPLLDPRTRCFSELPQWLESHAPQLKDKRVLMYCTGGVRCERASAFLTEMGVRDVYQLQGGIQRYLEAFPDGGLFAGKNFVYDDRVLVPPSNDTHTTHTHSTDPATTASAQPYQSAVPSHGETHACSPGNTHGTKPPQPAVSSHGDAQPTVQGRECGAERGVTRDSVVGRCQGCGTPWDDYSARIRCRRCRLLLLVCSNCQTNNSAAGTHTPPPLLCELCQDRQGTGFTTQQCATAQVAKRAGHASKPARGKAQRQAGAGDAGHQRKLRILCLHGFRHTATGFEGRTHALRHKLRDIADFHFIDAPHILPHYYRPRSTQDTTDTAHEPATADTAHNGLTADTQSEPATADTAYEAPNVEDAAPGSIRGKKEAAPYGSESQAVQPSRAVEGNKGAPSTSAECPPPAPVRRRRAWMVSPELLEWQRTGHMDEWQRTGHMDEELTLTCMLVQSVHIATRGRANNVFWFWGGGWQLAPDDASDPLQCQTQTEGWDVTRDTLTRAVREHGPFDGVLGFSQGAGIAALLCAHQQQKQQEPRHSATTPQLGLRFALLASGYVPPGQDSKRLLDSVGVIKLPSLHIYGGGTADRQIDTEGSMALAALFDSRQSSTLRHGAGHIIPGTRVVADAIRHFLLQFM